MKTRSILTIVFAFLCLSTSLFAQSADKPTTTPPVVPQKPVAPPKPVYQLDLEKPITATVVITFNAGSVSNFLYVVEQGGPPAISNSNLTAKQASQLINNYNMVSAGCTDSITMAINRAYVKYVQADIAKFTADTTAKYHPGTKPKK